jgi:hypothetical protein
MEVDSMKTMQLETLRFFALLFLLPGMAGLIVSAAISTHYLDTLPRWPTPEEQRMTPRSVHGIVVYQTVEENRKLTLLEDTSVAIFLIGLGLGLTFLEKWGGRLEHIAEQDVNEPEDLGKNLTARGSIRG